MKNKEKTNIIKKYLDNFPNVAIRTLSKKIYEENKVIFDSCESVRSSIRYFKGSNGKNNLKKIKKENQKYLKKENYEKKYNLPDVCKQEKYEPFYINANNVLIIGDVHIPFHDIAAIETMFDYTQNKKIDAVILNGDIMDCYKASVFRQDPTVDDLNIERDKTKQFLLELKKIYSKAKIYYKFGNHEKRFVDILKIKAPEFFGFSEFRLEILLGLFEMGIEYIEEKRFIILNNDLNILHAHEYKNAITSPASPARTLFLRTNATSLCNHYHQTSEFTKPKIDGKVTTTWSVGCLSHLHPEYMPLNNWNHGFALYFREDDNFYHVENKKIIKGKVV